MKSVPITLNLVVFLVMNIIFQCWLPANRALAQDFDGVLVRAQKGDFNAQSYVGHCLLAGKGVGRDEGMARYWYHRVANHPEADAKIVGHANLILGFMYFAGTGGEQNYDLARRCFETAAEQGYTDAHISIGLLYAKGWGVPKDYQKALQWWQLAVKKGHPSAMKYVNDLQALLKEKHS